MRRQQQDQQSRVFYELSALVLNILRSPPSPIPFSDHSTAEAVSTTSSSSSRRSSPAAQISPAGFASLLLGISLALMLCGSVTFFIGFILMPWVLGLVMVFYVAGIVSALSMLGRSLLCYATAPSTPRKDIPGERYSQFLGYMCFDLREIGVCFWVCFFVLLEFIALFLANDGKELVNSFGFRRFCSVCFVWFLDST
jgi:hypothetical protein